MASLRKDKAALFGTSNATGGAKSRSAATTAGSKVVLPKANLGPRVSPAVVKAKTEEAQKLIAEAEAYLKTSVFQWQPDYMGAAPKFEGAGNAYRAAESMELAHDAMVRCSQAYAAYGSYSAAANAMQNAAKMNKDPRKHFEDMLAAASLWGEHGDLPRMSQMFVGAAESDGASENEKSEYLREACNILIPFGSTDGDLKSCDVKGVEVLKKLFKFDMAGADREKAMETAQFLARVSEALEQDTVLWKCLAAITVLQLLAKDVIAAEQTYIQEHLSKRGYGTSKEAEVVEELLNAFKNSDGQQLQVLQKNPSLFYLDKETKDMVLALTLAVSTTQGLPKPVSTSEVVTEMTEEIVPHHSDWEAGGIATVSVTSGVEEEDDDEIDLA